MKFSPTFSFATLLLAAAVVALPVSAQVEFTPIKQQFNANLVSDLVVNVSNANIVIHTSNRPDIDIELSVTGQDLAKKDDYHDYYESQNFNVILSKGVLKLLSEPRGFRGWHNPPAIDVAIKMPANIYPDLNTSSGDILINELKAGAKIRTITGTITVDSISGGPIGLQSSSGDITTKELRGSSGKIVTSSLMAQTIQGSLNLGLVTGENLEMNSFDGNISADRVDGGFISVKSINGNIQVGEFFAEKTLVLQSSSGNISTGKIDASSLITRAIQGSLNLGLVTGENLEMNSFDGNISADRVDGGFISVKSINGNIQVGEFFAEKTLVLQSSSGNISTGKIDASSLITRAIQGSLNLGFIVGEKLEMTSSSGNITADRVDGESVSVRTMMGHMEIDYVTAKHQVNLSTSSGNIVVYDIKGSSVFANTTQGNILTQNISSKGTISLETSSGNITTDYLKGQFLIAKTTTQGDIGFGLINAHADIYAKTGDIQIDQLIGSLTLNSSNGDIGVGMTDIQYVRIDASNGDVTLSAPQKFPVSLDLSGKNLDLNGWDVSSEMSSMRGIQMHALKRQNQDSESLIHVRAPKGDIILCSLEDYSISNTTAVPPPVP